RFDAAPSWLDDSHEVVATPQATVHNLAAPVGGINHTAAAVVDTDVPDGPHDKVAGLGILGSDPDPSRGLVADHARQRDTKLGEHVLREAIARERRVWRVSGSVGNHTHKLLRVLHNSLSGIRARRRVGNKSGVT